MVLVPDPSSPTGTTPALHGPLHAICFDWGGTLMTGSGPPEKPMADWPDVGVVAGAVDCLAALHQRVPLCIATNAGVSSETDIRRALARAGLDRYITHVFCRASLGVSKRQPAFWQEVAGRLRLPPAEILMVGDSLEHDVLAPARSGLQSLLVGRDDGSGGDTPPRCLGNLRELPELVFPHLGT